MKIFLNNEEITDVNPTDIKQWEVYSIVYVVPIDGYYNIDGEIVHLKKGDKIEHSVKK